MNLFHRVLHGGSQERRRIFFRARILTALCAFCVTLILYYLFLRCQTMELMIASTAALCVTIVLGALEPAKCPLCREKIKTRNSILLYFYRCPNCEFTAQRKPDGRQEEGGALGGNQYYVLRKTDLVYHHLACCSGGAFDRLFYRDQSDVTQIEEAAIPPPLKRRL